MDNPVMSHMLSPSTKSILVLTPTRCNQQQTVRDKEPSGRLQNNQNSLIESFFYPQPLATNDFL
jgi:hypothetical protein